MSDRFILNLFAYLRKQILNIMSGLPENKLSLVPWVTKAKRNTALFQRVIEPGTRRER